MILFGTKSSLLRLNARIAGKFGSVPRFVGGTPLDKSGERQVSMPPDLKGILTESNIFVNVARISVLRNPPYYVGAQREVQFKNRHYRWRLRLPRSLLQEEVGGPGLYG